MENYSSVERTSSSLKKSVQKKTKLNYEGDSVVTVSHVKLDDEMFFNNGASTLSNDNSILQSEQVAEDIESKAVVSPTIRVACDGNISCYEEVKLGDVLMATVDRNQKTLESRKLKVCYHCNTHQSNLGKHIIEHHATRIGKGLKCNYCGRIIQKKLYNFNEHLKTHNDAMHFLCTDCGIGFKRAAAYRKHLESVHANCDFACNTCGKTFKCSTALRAHKYTHTKEYNLPCNICGKRFRYTRDLLNHELTHTDAKPQKCSICGKAFRTQSQVLRHVKQQHGTNIIYYCALCSYSVIQKCNLKIHMKRHTGVKYGDIFLCSTCLTGFPSCKLLNEHKSTCCKKTA